MSGKAKVVSGSHRADEAEERGRGRLSKTQPRGRSRSPSNASSGATITQKRHRRRSRSPLPARPRHEGQGEEGRFSVAAKGGSTSQERGERGRDRRGHRGGEGDDAGGRLGGHHHHHHRTSHKTSSARPRQPREGENDDLTPTVEVELPFGARALSRWDFAAFEPLFAHYLELHKQVKAEDLGEREQRARWKSFVRRWNAGRLPEGWYEPEMFLRVVQMRVLDAEEEEAGEGNPISHRNAGSQVMTPPHSSRPFEDSTREGGQGRYVENDVGSADDEDDDDYGPPPPPPSGGALGGQQPLRQQKKDPSSSSRHPGPVIPSAQDLSDLRAEAEEARDRSREDLRLARRADRAEQRERLDDVLPPRADAGTHERKVEKRRLLNEKLRGFRDRSPGGGMEETNDEDLLGLGGGAGVGGGSGADDYRRALASLQRKKTERELRREAEARAKKEELEEKLRGYRAREERKIEALRELARQRFG